MSWQELSQGDFAMRYSEVESQRFGLRISRLSVPLTASLDGRTAAGLIAQSDDDVVIVRYPATRSLWFHDLMTSGWDIIFADTLIYLGLEVGGGRRTESRLTSPAPGDHDLEAFVANIFADHPSHYAANPLLDREAAAAGYGDWAQRSVRAGGAFTLGTPAGQLVGFATTLTIDGHTEWTLSGISPQFQGTGVLNQVMALVEDIAIEQGSKKVVGSAVSHHTNIQKSMVRFGFEPIASFVTVHAVRPGLLHRSNDLQ